VARDPGYNCDIRESAWKPKPKLQALSQCRVTVAETACPLSRALAFLVQQLWLIGYYHVVVNEEWGRPDFFLVLKKEDSQGVGSCLKLKVDITAVVANVDKQNVIFIHLSC